MVKKDDEIMLNREKEKILNWGERGSTDFRRARLKRKGCEKDCFGGRKFCPSLCFQSVPNLPMLHLF